MPVAALSGPYRSLLPPGAFVFDDVAFEKSTKQMKRNLTPVPLPAVAGGFGQAFSVRIPKNGVLGHMTLDFAGTATVTLAGGTAAVGPRWWEGFLRTVALTISGGSTDFQTSGLDLAVDRFRRNMNVADPTIVSAINGAGGVTNLELAWEIPFNLSYASEPSGGLFTLSSNVELNIEITTAAMTEVFALTGAATVAIAGVFTPRIVWYSVPPLQMSDGSSGMLLPSLGFFRALKRQQISLPGGGEQLLNLDHIDGRMVGMHMRAVNGVVGSAYIANDATGYQNAGIRFGTTEIPLQPDVTTVARENILMYRARPPHATYDVLDARANLVRDSYVLSDIPDPQIDVTFAQGLVPAAGAFVEVGYEVLIPIATGVSGP